MTTQPQYRPPAAVDMLATWGASPPPVVSGRDPMTYAQPGPPPWDQAAWTGNGPAPVKSKSKGKLVLVVIGLATLLLCGGLGMLGALAGGNDPGPALVGMPTKAADQATGPAKKVSQQPSASEEATSRKLGQTFRSGDFEYTIHKVKTGMTTVGGEYIQEKAQGSFTRLDLTVKNVSDKPRYFDTDLRIKLQDAQGRQFSSSSQANVVANDAAKGWFTEINPGNSIRAYAFFDLPKDTPASRIVISAGLFDFEADAIVPLS
jgi:hypothetical protein